MQARRLISRATRRMEVERFDPGPIPDDGILVRNDCQVLKYVDR